MKIKNMIKKSINQFDIVSPFQSDPFVGHLSTPITASSSTKAYLSLLPIYKLGLSPLLRGVNIGLVHGYFLLGPFLNLGPLRESAFSGYIAILSVISLLIILTTGLLIYGYVSFSTKTITEKTTDFLSPTNWTQFSSGFLVGGFAGSCLAYLLLTFFA